LKEEIQFNISGGFEKRSKEIEEGNCETKETIEGENPTHGGSRSETGIVARRNSPPPLPILS
jgi:hypothetical protein